MPQTSHCLSRACHRVQQASMHCLNALLRGGVMAAGIALSGIALSGIALPGSAQAQTWPTKTVRIIVPFGPGAPDSVGRIIAQPLAQQLGQSFVVDNRPGANGLIGTEMVAKAAPDGYTLLVVSTSFAVNPSMYKKLPYSPTRDFDPVSVVASTEAYILGINPSVPANNLPELLALLKKPGAKFAFGTPGVGNTLHLAAELFMARTGTKMVHIPYKGAGQAIAGLVANDVQVMFMTPPLSLPQIRAGKVRAIGYTNKTRAAYLPEVPTMAEGGVNGVEMDGGWYGMFAPAGTPPEIVNKLYAEIRKALALPAVKERLNGLGLDAVGNSPADYRKLVEQQIRDYAEMVKLAGIPPE